MELNPALTNNICVVSRPSSAQSRAIRAPTFCPAGWVCGFNEMLHAVGLACSKCSVNLCLAPSCAFESLFSPSLPAPAQFPVWAGLLPLGWE